MGLNREPVQEAVGLATLKLEVCRPHLCPWSLENKRKCWEYVQSSEGRMPVLQAAAVPADSGLGAGWPSHIMVSADSGL